MGECFMTSRGGGQGSTSSINDTIIVNNGYFTPPVTGNYSIVVVGGGGSAGWYESVAPKYYGNGGGGGSGYINCGTFSLINGSSIYITIGSGGNLNSSGTGKSGGTTSFGNYISALGGTGGNMGFLDEDTWAPIYGSGGKGSNNGFSGGPGGYLYTNGFMAFNSNNGSYQRLYYGDGGDGNCPPTKGNSGYCAIRYLD